MLNTTKKLQFLIHWDHQLALCDIIVGIFLNEKILILICTADITRTWHNQCLDCCWHILIIITTNINRDSALFTLLFKHLMRLCAISFVIINLICRSIRNNDKCFSSTQAVKDMQRQLKCTSCEDTSGWMFPSAVSCCIVPQTTSLGISSNSIALSVQREQKHWVMYCPMHLYISLLGRQVCIIMHACTHRYTIHAWFRFWMQKCVDQTQLNDACIACSTCNHISKKKLRFFIQPHDTDSLTSTSLIHPFMYSK